MVDTIRLTAHNVQSDMLKDADRWQFLTSSDGEMLQQRTIIRLNEKTDGEKTVMYCGTIGLQYNSKDRYLNISCSSIPALIYGTSFRTVAVDDMKKVADAIQQQVNPFIEIDCSQMVVTRLDNSLLYDMQASPSNYIALLDSVTRDKQFRYNKTYFQMQTLQMRNRQKTIGFYDKYAKNAKNEHEMIYLDSHEDSTLQNKLRYEIQNKSAKALKTVTKSDYTTLAHVHEDQFISSLHQQRISEFEKHFKYDSSSFQTLLNIHSTMKKKSKRTAINDSVWYLMLQTGTITIEDIKKLLIVENYTRQAVHRIVKKLTALQSVNLDKLELLNELHQKIKYHAA